MRPEDMWASSEDDAGHLPCLQDLVQLGHSSRQPFLGWSTSRRRSRIRSTSMYWTSFSPFTEDGRGPHPTTVVDVTN